MKFKIHIQFITMLVLFVTNDAFANLKSDIKSVALYKELCIENVSCFSFLTKTDYGKELSVAKKIVDGLSIYSFTPNIKTDKDTFLAVENRLNVLVEGFVSLSVDDKNEVQLVLDSAVVTEERVAFSLTVLMKIYEYSNYVIK